MVIPGGGRFPLDPRQLAAVEENEPTVLVLGSHRTGRSQVLVGRVAFLLERGADPRRISVVTVRDEAAESLRRRILGHPAASSHAGNVFVGTIAQLSNEVLRDGGARALGISPYYTVWDEPACLEMLQLGWKARGDRNLTKRELRQVLRWRERNYGRWHEAPSLPARKQSWWEVDRVVTAELELQNAVLVKELPALALRALQRDDALREEWSHGGTHHLLADEAEDLTTRELALLQALMGPTRSLMAAIDPMQRVRDWANSSAYAHLATFHPKAAVHVLRTDHSSSQTLFRTAAALRQPLAGPAWDPGDGDCAGPSGEPALLVEQEGDFDDIANCCLDEIQRLHKLGMPLGDMAVLDRRGRALDWMRTRLVHRDIPHRVLGEPPTNFPTDARCAAALLTLLLNPHDLHAARIAAAPDHPNRDRLLPEGPALELRGIARERGQDLIDAARDLHGQLPEGAPERHFLANLVRGYDGLLKRFSDREADFGHLWPFAMGAVLALKPLGLRGMREPGGLGLLALWAEMREIPGESRRDFLCRFLDLLSPALYPARSRGDLDALNIGDFASAKGLGFQAVFLLDVSEQATPGRRGRYGEELDSELRQLVIAVTRASRRLTMYHPSDTGMAGARYVPSRFLQPAEHLLDRRSLPFRPLVPF